MKKIVSAFFSVELPKRILILDDEELLSWCIEFELKRLGYEVRIANDLHSGQEALQTFAPSLIICDQNFPEGKSLTMLSKWNETHAGPETILITAYTPPTVLEMAKANSHVCLSKPFELPILMGIIDSFFSQKIA